MSELINQLKKEHKILLEMLEEVRVLGISKPQAQQKMMKIKTTLLNHLNREDSELYPRLHMESENNKELKSTLDMFCKDMEEISKVAITFFEKYQNGGNEMEFARDFGKLNQLLSTRIRREEQILYLF